VRVILSGTVVYMYIRELLRADHERHVNLIGSMAVEIGLDATSNALARKHLSWIAQLTTVLNYGLDHQRWTETPDAKLAELAIV
jgi:hypothetical protein